MPFNRKDWQNKVFKMLGAGAGDARRTGTFTKASGGWDPINDIAIGDVVFDIKQCVIVKFRTSEYQEDNIEAGDVKILAAVIDTDPEITNEDTDCVIDGVNYDIIDVDQDPLKVVYFIQARVK